MAYELLSWKVHHPLIKVKFEPYLGFLHSLAEGKPGLICDFMIVLLSDRRLRCSYCRDLQKKDFIMKNEDFSKNRKGNREYLSDSLTQSLTRSLNGCFKTKVKIPRIRMEEQQEIGTLISEEALLFASYLRNEKQTWAPRIVSPDYSK